MIQRDMHPERWDRVRELFHRALDLPADDRSAFLNTECTDADVRAEVKDLLLGADTSMLESPAVDGVREAIQLAMSDPASSNGGIGRVSIYSLQAETEPRVIGRYVLVEKIGEGGMGEVWRAEQTQHVRREVAVKLIKAGMNTREVIARFESERQALALMNHPAIAKVFDAGITPDGAPYFVMEYAAGMPITTYCDNHTLTTRERLELFVSVCEGVQHAHQKAIIHRDLKPSNILVVEVDGRATPKIIDFGVAKALTQKLIVDTVFTRVGALIGTPEYMSPEQADSCGEDIDTRTDVYSLGIIFYELLAGAPPITFQKVAFDEFLRKLREQEPAKPSTQVRTQNPVTSTEIARKRRTEPWVLAKQIRGDLDAIALKALEKDRSRRYSSASEFAADIARYLRNEAVLAVAPSLLYRSSKFIRRHRAPLITVAAFVVMVILAGAISIRQSIRANREAAVAQAVNDFLQNDLLAQASAAVQSGPTAKPDPDLKVKTALDRAAERITGKFAKQPEVEASIRSTIGQTYIDLGLYPQARKQLERSVQLYRRVLGPSNRKTLKSLSQLGHVAELQGQYPQAQKILNDTLSIERRTFGRYDPDTLTSLELLARVYVGQGKYAQAEPLQSEALGIRRLVLGSEKPDTIRSMNNLVSIYVAESKYSQAQALCEQTLQLEQRRLGIEHPMTLGSMISLASIYDREGKYKQAEELFRQTLQIERRVLGPAHYNTLICMNDLALVYYFQGKYAEAEAVDHELLNVAHNVFPDHPTTLVVMSNLALVYTAEGEFFRAEALLNQTLERQRRMLGPQHPYVLLSMHNLAEAYAAEGRYAEAENLFMKTLEARRRVLGPDHADTLITLSAVAFMYQREGKYTLAEKFAKQDLEGQRRSGPDDRYTAGTLADIALAYISQGKLSEGEPLAREAFDLDVKWGLDDWGRFRIQTVLGASLAGQAKFAEAEPLLLEGYQGMLTRRNRMAAADLYHLQLARQWIVQLYRTWGKPGKASTFTKETSGVP